MSDKVKVLSGELQALNEEDLEQIAGSGDENSVTITNEQREKVKDWYARRTVDISDMEPAYSAITNYGGVYPRDTFVKAWDKVKEDTLLGQVDQ